MGEIRRSFWLAAVLVAVFAAGCDDQAEGNGFEVDASALAVPAEQVEAPVPSRAMDMIAEGSAEPLVPWMSGSSLTGRAATPVEWADPEAGVQYLMGGECCTEPGQAAECWEMDAAADGAACDTGSDCIPGTGVCNTTNSMGIGLCTCATDDDCGEGICADFDGVKLCGPSWCNGFKICSCWGGCVWWHPNPTYTPADSCNAASLHCCDGGYPVDPTASGFCSNTTDCGGGECITALDCTAHAGNECIGAQCLDAICYYPAIDAANCASVMNPGETWADQDPPCCCNVDADCPTLPCVDAVYCDVEPSSPTYHQCIFDWAPAGANCDGEGWDPFGASDACNSWLCTATHECVQVFHDGAPCNADDDGCTQFDSCLNGDCVPGALVDCNDNNWCTGPDECVNVPDPPLHNSYYCSNPALPDANAKEYGYPDTDPCANRFCINGVLGPEVPVECGHLDDICNQWSCDPAGPDDNCDANTMLIGAECDADGNLCTTPDTCQDDGSGFAVCVAGPPVVCEQPANECMISTCNPATGTCDTVPNDGIPCGDDPCNPGTCGGGFCHLSTVDCSSAADQCNNGVCVPDGVVGYDCVPQPIPNGTACNADNNGCTVNDSCQAGVCTPGPAPNCNDGNICTSNACLSTGNNTYECTTTVLLNEPCNADDDGCTVNDYCNSAGTCTPGAPAACTPPTACHTSVCNSTGWNTYECADTAIPPPDCCLADGDCAALDCPGELPPVGCSRPRCNLTTNQCYCQHSAENTSCTDFDTYQYPPDCYEGRCNSSGGCLPHLLPISTQHNKCRELFDGGDVNVFGSFLNNDGQTSISVHGSTVCMQNNYYSEGPDCVDSSNVPLGQAGKDAVYAFRYQTPFEDDFGLWAYNIKVWSSFGATVYVSQSIETVDDCPEGASGDPPYPVGVDSERCMKAYASAPSTSNEQCHEGNEALGRAGCYPFLQPGDDPKYKCGGRNCSGTWNPLDPSPNPNGCGYHWYRRFYPAGCCSYNNNVDCRGPCDGQWDFPSPPHNCDIFNENFTYSNVANHLLYPDGRVAPGTIKTVFIFVDSNSAAAEGVFDISVERVRWASNPCTRPDDEARLFNMTDATHAGSVWTGTMENAVNSWVVRLPDPPCTGHPCLATAWQMRCGGTYCDSNCWHGITNRHNPPLPTVTCDNPWPGTLTNEFWPNQEFFLIHRDGGSSGPDTGNCCTVHGGAGCSVSAIQNCVCDHDPYCCDTYWDSLCVNQVTNPCGYSCDGGGSETYCAMVIEDETFNGVNEPGRADLILSLLRRIEGTGICSNSVWTLVQRWWDNWGRNTMAQFSVADDVPYKLEVSNRNKLWAPCNPLTQSCLYKIRIRLGQCGYKWPWGYHNIHDSSGDHSMNAVMADAHLRHWGYGSRDHQWELGNAMNADRTVRVRLNGNRAHSLRIYNQNRNLIATIDGAAGAWVERQVTVPANGMIFVIPVRRATSGDMTYSLTYQWW